MLWNILFFALVGLYIALEIWAIVTTDEEN